MTEEELNLIIQYFKLVPPDEDAQLLINDLVDEVKSLNRQLDNAMAANRHYLHYFFDGKIDEMAKTFKYMLRDQ